MSMNHHLDQRGPVHHQAYSTQTSFDPMLPFRHMRSISELLHHYLKGLLINLRCSIPTFLNALRSKTGIIFSLILMMLMRIWSKNFMQMQLLKVMSLDAGLGEKASQSLQHIWPRFFTSINRSLNIHRFMMIYVQMRTYSGMRLERTWNSH